MKEKLTRFLAIFPKKIKFLHFSKLKIFYQILAIVSVMSIFLIIQGFSSVGIINTMQQTTYMSFVNSNNLLGNLSSTRLYLKQLENNYLIAVNEKNDLATVIPPDLEPTVEFFADFNKQATDSVLKRIKTIRAICQSPADEANFKRVQKQLAECEGDLNNIQKTIMDLSIKTFTQNNEFSNSAKGNTVFILIISGLIAFMIGVAISNSITNSLKKISSATKALATGDLSQKIDQVGCPEVVGVVEGLNQATNGLRELVGGINEQSEALLRASEELKTASMETGQSATQVAEAMEQLAAGSTEQTNQINQTVETINHLSELVTKVTSDTTNIAASSGKVAESAKLGQLTTNDVTNAINEYYDTSQQASVVIGELKNASGRIGEIVSAIHDVADRTSLLALNAAIEAARAGEQGKGFAVVAQETGKLAEQSKTAADRISKIINEMRSQIEQAVTVMQQGIEKTQSGKELVAKSNVTFSEIFDLLKENIDQIEAVADVAQEMAKRNQDTIKAITTIASISEQSMAGTQEVSATAEEQSAAVEEVSSLAESLSGIALHLRESVSTFKINQDTDEVAG